MVNYLFKRSYRLSDFSNVPYKSLWGTRGVFTTVRLYSKKNNLILIDEHLKKFNQSIKKFDINFKLNKSIVLALLESSISLKKYDHLLRIACNKNILSISLRNRIKISKKFSIYLKFYQRKIPNFKHLNYAKVLNLQKKINLSNEEIVFYNNNTILEGSTSNIIFVKNNTLYIPTTGYYFGITLRYLLRETKMKIVKKNIKIDDLINYNEILLVGSGKTVINVSFIKDIKWKKSSVKIYKKLLNTYQKLLI